MKARAPVTGLVVVTLPAKLRRELYSEKRIREFDRGEAELDKVLRKRKPRR